MTHGLKRVSVLAAAAALAVVSFGTAEAGPRLVLPAAQPGETAIVQVAGGCGFGEHRGPYGGCRINHGPRGALRAAVTGLPGGCPPRMHRGPYGHCRY